jgi:hypothetical protein
MNPPDGEEINIKINRKASNVYIGKILLLFLFSALFAFLVSSSEEEDNVKGRQLTKEEYMANYENYKADLTDEPISVVFGTIVFMLAFTFFFGLYELLGIAFGRVVGMYFTNERRDERY